MRRHSSNIDAENRASLEERINLLAEKLAELERRLRRLEEQSAGSIFINSLSLNRQRMRQMEKTELPFWAMAISFFVCVLTTISLCILNMISLSEASLIAAFFVFVEFIIAWRILKKSDVR